MADKPTLEELVKLCNVWISRKWKLHSVKNCTTSGGKLHIHTDCGEVITVNRSKFSASARALLTERVLVGGKKEAKRYRKICSRCNPTKDRLKQFEIAAAAIRKSEEARKENLKKTAAEEAARKAEEEAKKAIEAARKAEEAKRKAEEEARRLAEEEEKSVEAAAAEFYVTLPEVLTELGRGVGKAQRELDMHSISVQNYILKDKELADYGINATWYTMPEVQFNLKMEYSVIEQRAEEGEIESASKLRMTKNIAVLPSNMKYNTLFDSSRKEESSLSIKFRPVPPPQFTIVRTEVPNLYGMTKKGAEAILLEAEIEVEFILNSDPEAEDAKTQITHQNAKPGDFLLNNEKLIVTVDPRD